MSKKFKIGNLNVRLYFWHYWGGISERYIYFKAYHFGLYYKKTVSVDSRKKGMKMFDDDNHVTTHTFGIELIWIKASISFTLGDIMTFKLD